MPNEIKSQIPRVASLFHGGEAITIDAEGFSAATVIGEMTRGQPQVAVL